MGGNIQVPNNIEDKTVLKRFLTDLVMGINGSTLFSGNVQEQNAALLGILKANPNLDFLNLVAKLNELRTDILTYVEDNLETVILQQQEDIAVIAQQFGTFYNQALAASWYGLSVKAGGAVAGLEVGSLDPDVTTPGDENSYFRVVANNFILGRAYEDLTQEEKNYLAANNLPNFGTVYNAQKQPVPALITTWDNTAGTYKHYFNGIVQFTNISGTPVINKTWIQATAPTSGMVAGDTWLNTSSSYASFNYNGSSWVSTGNKTYIQPNQPTFGCIAGDIWIDSDDNNKSYRFNGTGWDNTTIDPAVAINNGSTTINGGKITTGTVAANVLMPTTGGTTVWSGGGLVSQNFNGNAVGNIGSPTLGFRLSSNAGGSSADPNIYGAYIKGGTIDGVNLTGISLAINDIKVRTQDYPNNYGPILITKSNSASYGAGGSGTIYLDTLAWQGLSSGYLSNRLCNSVITINIVLTASAYTISTQSSKSLSGSIEVSVDNGSSWVTIGSKSLTFYGGTSFSLPVSYSITASNNVICRSSISTDGSGANQSLVLNIVNGQ